MSWVDDELVLEERRLDLSIRGIDPDNPELLRRHKIDPTTLLRLPEEPSRQGVVGRILSRTAGKVGESASDIAGGLLEERGGLPFRVPSPLGVMRGVFSPIELAARAATELPVIAGEELTGGERPPALETGRKVAQIGTEVLAPIGGAIKLLGRLRGPARAVKAAKFAGFDEASTFARETFNMTPARAVEVGFLKRSKTGGYDLTPEGMKASRTMTGTAEPVGQEPLTKEPLVSEVTGEGAATLRQPPVRGAGPTPGVEPPGVGLEKFVGEPSPLERALRRARRPALPEIATQPVTERIFVAGPPKSVTGKPRIVYRTVTEPKPKEGLSGRLRFERPGEAHVPKVEVATGIPWLRKPPRIDVTAPDAPVNLVRPDRLESVVESGSAHIDDLIRTRPDIAGGNDDVQRIVASSLLDDAERAVMNPDIDLDISGAFRAPWLRRTKRGVTDAKALIGLNSQTEVYRGIPAGEELVKKTIIAKNDIEFLSNGWVSSAIQVLKRYGDDVFEEAARVADGVHTSVDQAVKNAAAELRAILDDVAAALGIPAGTPGYLTNFWTRARTQVILERTRLIQVGPYVAEDIRQLAPKALHIKRRVFDYPADRYDIKHLSLYFRGAARHAVLGTEESPGYLQQIRPLLKDLGSESPRLQEYTAKYVNYFLGAPGTRSDQSLMEASRLIRSVEFLRTIGGNLTSPIYNTMQRTLTFAEVPFRHFLGALQDEIAFLRKDQRVLDILKRGRIDVGQSGATKLDVDLATQMENRLERGVNYVRDFLGTPFSFSERGNRVHSFFAGYRNALAKGLSENEAISAGRDLMFKTQFSMSEAERPARFRGAAGSVVGQFKTFQIKYAEFLKNNLLEAAGALKPGIPFADRLAAANKFVKFWGAQMAVGGTVAIPSEYINDVLEEKGLNFKGLAQALGVSFVNQIGFGTLAFRDFRSFLMFLPGPAVSHVQDILSGAFGVDFGQGGDLAKFVGAAGSPDTAVKVDLDDRVRRLTRSLPAGIQLNRLRRTIKLIQSGGEERAGFTIAESLGIRPPNLESKLRRRPEQVGITPGMTDFQRAAKLFIQGLGFQTPEEEEQSRLAQDVSRAISIRNDAISAAQEAFVAGESGEPHLARAERKIGLPEGTLTISPQARRAQRERATMTPLERIRKRAGRQLAGVGEEEE